MELIQRPKKRFICKDCPFTAASSVLFRNHFLSVHLKKDLATARRNSNCSVCGLDYLRISTHILKEHSTINFICNRCDEFFDTAINLEVHVHTAHSTPVNSSYTEVESAFNRRINTFERKFTSRVLNLEASFLKIGGSITTLVKYQLQLKHMLRFSVILRARYVKYDEIGGIDEMVEVPLRSKSIPILLADSPRIGKHVNDCFTDLVTRNEQFVNAGSGWVLNRILSSTVEIGKLYIRGGCHKEDSAKAMQSGVKRHKRKYLLDCYTLKNECFFNAIALGMLGLSVTGEGTQTRDLKKRGILARAYTKTFMNIKGITTPVDVRQVHKFERKNRDLKFNVNIYMIVSGQIIPVYKSKNSVIKTNTMIHLLLVPKYREHHYIPKFCDLNNEQFFHCSHCLNSFTSNAALSNHQEFCFNEESVKIEYPKPGDSVSFQSHEKKILQPIIGACDFEASLEPVSRIENAVTYNCTNCAENGPVDQCNHNTINLNHQVPTTYSIILLDKLGKIIFEKTESEEKNVMKKFFSTLDYLETNFYPLLQRYKIKDDYTQENEQAFAQARRCYLCKKYFQNHIQNLRKVRDHCHYTNQYLGAAHNNCNWRRTSNKNIPIFIHNFKNYDAQFILSGLKYTSRKIQGLPFNMEKMRTLNIGKITFIDSLQLLPSSLQELVNNLRNSDYKFPLLQQLPIFFGVPISPLLKKGVYPYEWATSITKLEREQYPTYAKFYSILRQENISIEEYNHGRDVYKLFNCQNMLDYCHLYCRLDTILLLEVISHFRAMAKKEFGLDCAQYISAPQMAYDCMLLTLQKPIALMTDSIMIMMCEQNVRGGVSFVNERAVKLKNYFKVNPEQNLDDKIQDQLLYIDANNLYSVAQSAPMPIGGYAWCTSTDLETLFQHISSIDIDNNIGFILEVDLEYPASLHAKHSSLPLLPNQEHFCFNDLSPFSKKSLKVLRGQKMAKRYKATKLVTNVKNKTKYVLHYRNLQTYVSAGIVLKKNHRAIKFKQERYLKPYIDLCTLKRKEAKNPFEKMLFKLFMNSVYGKFLQNQRKHFDVKICTKKSQLTKYFSLPNYKGHRILSETVVAVYLAKTKVKLDRLYATGFSILEISKNHMYNSWYNFIQPNLGWENVSVVLTDTDSLLLKVQNMSRNEMFEALKDCMDFSNYPKSHIRYNTDHQAIPGFFKDENAGNYLVEVIGLKSKCYITNSIAPCTKETAVNVVCKGIGKKAKTGLTLKTFRNVIANFSQIKADMYTIRSKNHQLYTQKLNKIALSTTDDKRFLMDCGRHTLPHGSQESTKCSRC